MTCRRSALRAVGELRLLSFLINRALQAVLSQNQIRFRGMSGTEAQRPETIGQDLFEPGLRFFLTLAAALAACALVLLLVLGGSTEAVVLSSLALLATIGAFFLFALAAGQLRFTDGPSTTAWLNAALDGLEEGVEVTDQTGKVIYCNTRFAAIVG